MRLKAFFGVAAILFASLSPVAAAGDGEWAPDAPLIAGIETAFRAQMASGMTDIGNHPAQAPASLDGYVRTYAGETVRGERIVVGALVDAAMLGKPPGIVIGTMETLPQVSDGGCGVMHLWYHVETHKIETVCNFRL